MNDKDLLLQSIAWAAEREPVITGRFYEILFARYPQVEPLFGRNTRDAQAQMLQDTILAALDHFDDAAWLGDTLGAIGAKHIEYNVRAEMYPWVGECLIATLAEHCGANWTTTHQGAWARTWNALSGLALAGAARATHDLASSNSTPLQV